MSEGKWGRGANREREKQKKDKKREGRVNERRKCGCGGA